MANNQKTQQTKSITQITPSGTVEVLYQKMGDRWFAFSCVGDDVFVGSISQEELEKSEKTHRITGNS
jgi:hypothetical protein